MKTAFLLLSMVLCFSGCKENRNVNSVPKAPKVKKNVHSVPKVPKVKKNVNCVPKAPKVKRGQLHGEQRFCKGGLLSSRTLWIDGKLDSMEEWEIFDPKRVSSAKLPYARFYRRTSKTKFRYKNAGGPVNHAFHCKIEPRMYKHRFNWFKKVHWKEIKRRLKVVCENNIDHYKRMGKCYPEQIKWCGPIEEWFPTLP